MDRKQAIKALKAMRDAAAASAESHREEAIEYRRLKKRESVRYAEAEAKAHETNVAALDVAITEMEAA